MCTAPAVEIAILQLALDVRFKSAPLLGAARRLQERLQVGEKGLRLAHLGRGRNHVVVARKVVQRRMRVNRLSHVHHALVQASRRLCDLRRAAHCAAAPLHVRVQRAHEETKRARRVAQRAPVRALRAYALLRIGALSAESGAADGAADGGAARRAVSEGTQASLQARYSSRG